MYGVHAHSVSGESIEGSLTVAPRDELVLFLNRDKFDLIVIYDDASETPGPPDAPISNLIRAIYVNAFRKILKRVPVLLIGGIQAWKRSFGAQEVRGLGVEDVPVPLSIPVAQPAVAKTESLRGEFEGVCRPMRVRVPEGDAGGARGERKCV